MGKITVFNYKGYDVNKDVFVNHGRYATLEYINTRPLVAIKEDSLELDDTLLDEEGRYIPREAK